MKEKREKAIEDEVADLTDWTIGEKGLYHWLGGVLPGKLGAAFDDMDAEHMEKRDNIAKEKIEFWRDRIKNTPERGTKNWYNIHIEPILQ
jgi:hypothetical protein